MYTFSVTVEMLSRGAKMRPITDDATVDDRRPRRDAASEVWVNRCLQTLDAHPQR